MEEITSKELEEKLKKSDDLKVIDVREDDEVETGKIPGAKHIPLAQIPESLDELDEDERYYIVCRSGGRSERAAKYLLESGYDAVNVDGGMTDWTGITE